MKATTSDSLFLIGGAAFALVAQLEFLTTHEVSYFSTLPESIGSITLFLGGVAGSTVFLLLALVPNVPLHAKERTIALFFRGAFVVGFIWTLFAFNQWFVAPLRLLIVGICLATIIRVIQWMGFEADVPPEDIVGSRVRA